MSAPLWLEFLRIIGRIAQKVAIYKLGKEEGERSAGKKKRAKRRIPK
jgi:hypothetical protein